MSDDSRAFCFTSDDFIELERALNATYPASLTRRDLLKQAGELDDLAAELKKHGHSDAAQTARIRAHVKRHRAQELGQ